MASVCDFLIERLENLQIDHLFGIVGDYIIHFLDKVAKNSKIKIINTTNEESAGFAADCYARIKGLGVVATTFNVGTLKLCNSVACAYAERSPLIIIAGAPGEKERQNPFLPNHLTSNFDSQANIFKNITCDQAILANPATAGYEIDRVLQSLKTHKQPIYIELRKDVAFQPIQYDVYTQGTPASPATDLSNLEDALKEVVSWFDEAISPVILAGVEVGRYHLGTELLKWAEKHNIPIVCTLLSKSVIDETHPLYVGTYAGSNSNQQHVRELVEESDCLLVFGETLTEATAGYRPTKAFVKRNMITCNVDTLRIKNHSYTNVLFVDFCKALFKIVRPQRPEPILEPKVEKSLFVSKKEIKLTTLRLFEKINSILNEDMAVIADCGDALLGASDLMTCHAPDTFYACAHYLSMGWAIPAALGAQLAKKNMRPIVVVGDGSLQMSAGELSTIGRNKLNPIIFVLNNGGYVTERVLIEGSFNEIVNWNYEKIPQLIGIGQGVKVETEEQLDQAVQDALKSTTYTIINCVVDKKDISPALKRLTNSFHKKVS